MTGRKRERKSSLAQGLKWAYGSLQTSYSRTITWYGYPGNIPRITLLRENINVAVAAYVTTQARIKLYEYLSQLGESALYCDTDSVVFVQKDNDPQKWKRGIIWATSLTSWRSTALAILFKNLFRVAQKTMRFHFLPLHTKTYNKVQDEG